jgi:hypothetical protein
VSAWAAGLAVIWLVGGGLAEAPELREEKAAGLVFVVPADAEVTSHLGEADDVGVVAITRREEVLIITVYRGRDRPRERKALKRHVTAFEREISSQGEFTTRKFRAALLDGKRPGREFMYTWLQRPHKAQIVAARTKKATVVTAWTRPSDRRTDFATKVLDSLRVE